MASTTNRELLNKNYSMFSSRSAVVIDQSYVQQQINAFSQLPLDQQRQGLISGQAKQTADWYNIQKTMKVNSPAYKVALQNWYNNQTALEQSVHIYKNTVDKAPTIFNIALSSAAATVHDSDTIPAFMSS